MSKLSPQLDTIRIKYDLSASDFWELPQRKGTWIVKHSALEKVAAKADIQFDAPQIIEANTEKGIAVLAVNGCMYADSTEPGESGAVKHELLRAWATGEAAPNNNKNAYPWAMAEKRAKDRVILKLTGIEAYSEEEAEDFKRQAGNEAQEAPTEPAQGQWKGIPPDSEYARYGNAGAPEGTLKSSAQAKRDNDWPELKTEVDACLTLEALNLLAASPAFVKEARKMPRAWQQQLSDYIQTCRDEFAANPPKAADPFGFDKLDQAPLTRDER